MAAAAAAASDFAAGSLALDALDLGDWSPHAVVNFINSLPAELSPAQLTALDEAFAFSASANAEISRAWFIQVAQRRYEPAYAAMQAHLGRHGRMKLIVPVYAALDQNGVDGELARELFQANKSRYHPIAVDAVQSVLP